MQMIKWKHTSNRHNPKQVNWQTTAFTTPGAKIHHETDFTSITEKNFLLHKNG